MLGMWSIIGGEMGYPRATMSPSGLETPGKRGIWLEKCTQQESTAKMELEGLVVALQQVGPFERVVVTLF